MKKKNINLFDDIIRELFAIRNPHTEFNEELYKEFKKKIVSESHKEKTPKKKFTMDGLSQKAFFELTTARNRNLIRIDEQEILRQTVVGFFGLSVGSNAAVTWIMESRADVVKIVDPDRISASNLNRMRNGWEDVGKLKIETVEREVRGMNPYIDVINSASSKIQDMKHIFESFPPIQVVVDEIDNFEGKIQLRKLAKEKKIPLISAADVGDNVIVDVERYDEIPQPELFLGRVPQIEKIVFNELSDKQKKKLIIELIGFEKNSMRMLESLLAIGGSITTWPQLGATATVAGGIIATIIKKIALKEVVKSGRYYVSLDDIFVHNFNARDQVSARKKKVNQIKELIEKFDT